MANRDTEQAGTDLDSAVKSKLPPENNNDTSGESNPGGRDQRIDGTGHITLNEFFTHLAFAVCKIETPKGSGTGFIGHLEVSPTEKKHFLVTSNHVLDGNEIQHEDILIILHNRCVSGDQLFAYDDCKERAVFWVSDGVYKGKGKTLYGLDYTMIRVDETKIDEKYSFDLTPTELNEMDQLYIVGFPFKDGKQPLISSLAAGPCRKIIGFFIYHGCDASKGSSGSPIVKEVNGNLRVVAIHRSGVAVTSNLHYGTAFKAVLCHANLIRGQVPSTNRLMVKSFHAKVRANVKLQVNHFNIEKIDVKFALMVVDVEEALKGNVDVHQLLVKLRGCTAVRDRDVPLFAEGTFDVITSIEKLFEKLSGYWHIYDYSILKFLILAAECEAAEKIFEEFLSSFSCSAIINSPLKFRTKILPSGHQLWVKVEQDEVTVGAEKEVRELICKNYDLERYALIVKGIKEGCTELVYQISPSVKSYILQQKLLFHDASQLKSHKITTLKLDDKAELTMPSEFSSQSDTFSFIKQQKIMEGVGMITKEYLNKQLTAVCKIEISSKISRKSYGTGFIGHLHIYGKARYFLITANHVLYDKSVMENVHITFEYSNMLSGKIDSSGTDLTSNSATARKSITLSGEWFTDPKTSFRDYTKYGLDYTMIEVEKKEVDELKIYSFDLTPTELDENDQLIVAGHPEIDGVQQHLQVLSDRCKKILGFFVYHGCSTCKGLSGSPILKVVGGKLRVVAIHRGYHKNLKIGTLFSAVLSHATLIDGDVPQTKVLTAKQFFEKVKWKPLEMADLLQLLQPVESSWDTLGRELLKDELQYKLDTIESDCFHEDNSKKALNDVLSNWLECTVSAKRTWQTLCDTAKGHGDVSLENYMQENCLESNEEPTMRYIHKWSKNSPLRTGWYNFAVDLVGKAKAKIIHAKYYGGGNHSCLQRMLDVWYNSTIDHSWQMIIDALTEMDKFPVIESIEKHCLTW